MAPRLARVAVAVRLTPVTSANRHNKQILTSVVRSGTGEVG